jgi:Tol biopolymer transport system component
VAPPTPSQKLSFSVGAMVGRYQILGPLEIPGLSGVGEIYRARDQNLERDVVVKVLPRDLAFDRDRVRRFEEEAHATGRLNHPNILAVHDVGTHEGAPYLVAEVLAGHTLRDLLSRGPLPTKTAIDVALQIARGLGAAHEKGIVHRDLKPESIFVTRDGLVKVFDFGVAKLTGTGDDASPDARTEPGQVLGTVAYRAPEQVRGRPADQRGDLFSLGAILYEMVIGARAFVGESDIEAMNAILKDEPKQLVPGGAFSPELERIVRHCLEKIPEERFQSARDLAFQLEALTVGGAASALRSIARTAPVAARKRSPIRWVIVALAFCAVGAGGFFLGRTPESQLPSFQRLTFRRGQVRAARFAPGHTLIYSAAWNGDPPAVFSTLPDSTESRTLVEDAEILSVSSGGELAVLLHPRLIGAGLWARSGTLARLPIAGNTPRELAEAVEEADWSTDGTQLAVVREIEGQARLEFPIGNVRYSTSGWISSLRIAPDGKRIAFIDHPVKGDDAGAIAILDLGGLDGKRRRLTEDWGSAQGLAWSAGSDALWFTAAERHTRELYRVGLDGKQRLMLRTPGNLTLHDRAADGRLLITSDLLRSGVEAMVPGATEERDLSWLDWSVAMDLTPDGKQILVDEESDGVYLRPTSGAPPVRLGDGRANSLSPDGKWAAATSMGPPPGQITLLPTGVGLARPATHDAIHHVWAHFLPDGKRLLFAGNEPGKGTRLFVQPIDGGAPRAITPEFMDTLSVPTADGTKVAGVGADRKVRLYPIDGDAAPTELPGIEPGEMPLRFSGDDSALYVYRPGELPARVVRVALPSGQRTPWRALQPADRAGLVAVSRLLITPSGESYAYRYFRDLSDLYLVADVR